jgi:hypothetical protein
VLLAAHLRASSQSARDEVALQLHPGGQGEHVAAFLPGDRDRVLGERAGDFLQRQAVLADLDEMVKQPGLLAADAVIQADQQAVQPPSQVFVLSRVHAPHSGAGKGVRAAGKPARSACHRQVGSLGPAVLPMPGLQREMTYRRRAERCGSCSWPA